MTLQKFLNARGIAYTENENGLTVGGYLNLRGTGITEGEAKKVRRDVPSLLQWQGGKYILCDGILAEVLSHHGNVWKTRPVGRKNETFIVSDCSGKYAHGSTIEEARKDLIYKVANRDKSRYETLNTNSVLTHEEAIEAYRVITGACSAGTRHFVENVLPADRVADSYTVGEIIELTRGQYGHDKFAAFFQR